MKRTMAAVGLLASVACATTGRKVELPTPSRPTAELVGELGSADPTTRTTAAWALVGARGDDPSVSGPLIAALDDPERAVREAATWALWNLRGTVQGRPDSSTPILVSQTKPLYPEEAFHKKLAGSVNVLFLIGEDGRVTHAEVRESARGLDAAALACVRQWVFKPAERNGRPVASIAAVPVFFRIY